MVSNKGRVCRVMKAQTRRNGYKYASLSLNNKFKNNLIHRLVATAFIPNPENKPCVNHLNRMKTDNRIENLEWCTYSENNTHCIKTGRKVSEHQKLFGKYNKDRMGHLSFVAKLICQYDLNNNFIREWGSLIDVQRGIGINAGNICLVCRGKKKTAGGFIWKYK